MSKVGCVIIEDFKRPDKALVEKFRNVAVANLDDCMNRISAVHEDIRPVNKGKLLGPAFTVKVPSGIAGIVVDGSLRDVDAMSQLTDFPVYARGITPDGPYKNGPGEINTPIVCGGRLVNPGYIVIGDEDGVIFVNPSDAPELLEKVNKLHENEIRIINTIEKDGTYIRPWVNEKLESLEVERINYVEY